MIKSSVSPNSVLNFESGILLRGITSNKIRDLVLILRGITSIILRGITSVILRGITSVILRGITSIIFRGSTSIILRGI
jgi:hypothetical protein